MSFGGYFGGGSSSSGSSSSSSSSSSSIPSSNSAFSTSESTAIKQRVQSAVQTQVAVQNAKVLISKVNEVCFSHCIPNPGPSLSSKEQTCLSTCMEKYLDAWNTVNRTYMARLQREGAMVSGFAGSGGAGVGGGSSVPGIGGREMF